MWTLLSLWTHPAILLGLFLIAGFTLFDASQSSFFAFVACAPGYGISFVGFTLNSAWIASSFFSLWRSAPTADWTLDSTFRAYPPKWQ